MLTSLVSLQQQNAKKSKESMKLSNTEGESLHILWMNWWISMKFSVKMWLLIMLKVTKKQRFGLSHFSKNHAGDLFRVNIAAGWRSATVLQRNSGLFVFPWILHNFCYFVKHFEKLSGLLFLKFHSQLFLAWMWKVAIKTSKSVIL